MRIVIRTDLVTAPLRDSFGAIHHQRLAHWADVAGWLGFDRIFTFWIV